MASDGQVRMHVLGMEDGRALGTKPKGIGGVLLIAARDDSAVFEAQGGTDPKLRIGSVTLLGGTLGGLHQFTVFQAKFFVFINAYFACNAVLFHSKPYFAGKDTEIS